MYPRLALILPLLLGLTAQAHAQTDLSGAWHASALRIRYQITEWGPDCGPRPPAVASESGGSVQVVRRGDDLTFSGAVRWTTNRCASETPGLNRVASRYQGGHWTTRCQTPNGHAHPEWGVYRLTARDDGSLRYTETTRWNWALRESTCVATRTATRSFTRPESETPVATAMTERPPETAPQCTPGAPARITLRPSQADVEPGARQCFRARVVDAAGCPVPRRRVALTLSGPSERGRIEGRCFVAAGSAAEAEGTVEIQATSRGLRASARVHIAPTDLTGLRAQGGAGPRFEADEGAEAHGASGVSARVGGDDPPWIWIGAATALVLLLLLVGIALWITRRKRLPAVASPFAESEPPAKPDAEPASDAVQSPTMAQEGAATDIGDNLICPMCRRGYPPGSRFCPTDSETLVRYADYRARAEQQHRERICPTCGEHFPAGTIFCGKDGTALSDG